MSNTFGKKLTLTTFGSSHGEAVGGVVDGFPRGIAIDFDKIRRETARRKTGVLPFSSQRNEDDEAVFISGIECGVSTGFPIAFFIKNTNARSGDYDKIREVFRPSHSDFTYHKKYGISDFAGGMRASGRETVSWVVAGSLAKQALEEQGIEIASYVRQIGTVVDKAVYRQADIRRIEHNSLPTPDSNVADKMLEELEAAQRDGDSLGGVVCCIVSGVPAGRVGNPIFDKLSSRLAAAMLTIPSAKGFDYGDGFELAAMRGSAANDIFTNRGGSVRTATNHSGGIQGGISNGEDIMFRVAFKPVPSIGRPQQTVDIHGAERTIEIRGRHDVCIVPRVLPVVEALAALVVLDMMQC